MVTRGYSWYMRNVVGPLPGGGPGDKPRGTRTGGGGLRLSPMAATWAAALAFMKVLFIVTGALLGPLYIGRSGVTTGTIVSSPNFHPQISFQVDGQTYTITTTENNPSWQIGQEVKVSYNPRNPQQATTGLSRAVAIIFVGVGVSCLVGALLLIGFGLRRQHTGRWLIDHGQRVDATITGVIQSPLSQVGTQLQTSLNCQWTSPDRVVHTFRSTGRLRERGYQLSHLPSDTVPVYVDPARPDSRYHVDDAALNW